MNLHYFNVVFFIIIEHFVKIFNTQNVPPISPCPKMFQYRFDGNEWFALLGVHNPENGDTLNLKVTLSLRGKPATNYLGEIELLTRGQLESDLPVIYKVKFPKSRFPPKLIQIAVNKQIICLGPTDHNSVLLTQIVLEHTRKFTYLSDDGNETIDNKLPVNTIAISTPVTPLLVSTGGEFGKFFNNVDRLPIIGSSKDTIVLPLDEGMNNKHLFNIKPQTKDLLHISKHDCGIIDNRVRYQVLHYIQQLNVERRTRGGDDDDDDGSVDLLDNPNLTNGGGPIVILGGDDKDDNDHDNDDDTPIKMYEEMKNEPPAPPVLTRGAWPWLAAIYVNNVTSLTYQCTGTLVSEQIILSAAHCFQLYKELYTANEVLVFLGRHNLNNWSEEGSLAAPVDDIFIHPDYKRELNNYDADIAIIVLKNVIRFNTFIRPACLWRGPTELKYIVGEQGVVVGWSRRRRNNQTMTKIMPPRSHTTIPRIIHSPILSNEECFKVNKLFENISSNRTFCAGKFPSSSSSNTLLVMNSQFEMEPAKRIAPCTGDSGAGLLLYRNNHWVLRGIVTGSIPKTNDVMTACNLNDFVVHTDIAMFLDWIYAFIF